MLHLEHYFGAFFVWGGEMINIKKYVKPILVIVGLAILVVCANVLRLHIAKIAEEQGDNAYEQENYALVISAYTRANNLIFWDRGRKAYLLCRRGHVYYEKEDFEKSIADFTKAIELYPKDEDNYLWRAEVYKEMKNYKLAIADFSKAIDIFGSYEYFESPYVIWDTYLSRADVYHLNKDYLLAITDYNYVIQSVDKNINFPTITDEEIDKFNEMRDYAISQKKQTERFLEWRKNIIGTFFVKVYPDDPETYEYEFLSVDVKNTTELILLLGYALNEYSQTHHLSRNGSLTPTNIAENNTELAQDIKDKMKQLGANVCMSTAFFNSLVVNLLLPDGTYTTVYFD